MGTPQPLLGQRFNAGLIFAAKIHATQLRKSSQVPYLAHLLSVSALVLEAGGDEDMAIAALLHDAVEDRGGLETLKKIEDEFGPHVAEIVDGCSDAYGSPKPPWRDRKEKYLAHLVADATPAVRRVSLADKLHNARSILRDLRQDGNRVWEKFNGGKSGTLWYYTSLVEIFKKTETNFMVAELERVISQIKEIANDQL
jgi:(p)ppGpp synthase/HD superfamily hydrolase